MVVHFDGNGWKPRQACGVRVRISVWDACQLPPDRARLHLHSDICELAVRLETPSRADVMSPTSTKRQLNGILVYLGLSREEVGVGNQTRTAC